MQTHLSPRYLVDYEKGKMLVFDRQTETFFPELIALKDFASLSWMTEPGSLAIENAHGATYSKWSKAQPWKTEEELRAFWQTCSDNDVELRFLPQAALNKYREYLGVDKSGENDLKAYHHALLDRPHLWQTLQRPENVQIHDRSKDIRDYDVSDLTWEQAGFRYRQDLKDDSRELSAADGGNKYKNSKPGKLAYDKSCIDRVRQRLATHTSEKSGITKGSTTFTFSNGQTVTMNLTDILWKDKKTLRETQYVACMMLLVNLDGQRYLDARTEKAVSWKMIKQYGMVSSSFHMKPGFLRPKFYHHGMKPIVKELLSQQFGTTKRTNNDGSEQTIAAIDWTNAEHRAYFRWIRNTCRIAYEQTTKAMIGFLDHHVTVDQFFGE